MATNTFLQILLKLIRTFLIFMGCLFGLALMLSFTSLPFWGYYWLGTSKSEIREQPEYIVLLGGGGMPSESNLMRAYFVCRAAAESPQSTVVISIPGDTADQRSTARLVAAELVQKGIGKSRIRFEANGTNTRSQALELLKLNGENLSRKPILLVTSPEHMRRAVLTFRKAGFQRVGALPAFENALEANLIFKGKELGGNKLPVPEIGGSISVRYQFWNHLKYELLVARELTALTYYKLKGWI